MELAQKALREIPIGGKTPLSAGLLLSLQVILRERRLHPEVRPLLILLTDGAGNVSVGNLPRRWKPTASPTRFVMSASARW